MIGLISAPIPLDELVLSELGKAIVTYLPEDKWLGGFVNDQEIGNLMAHGIVPIISSHPRLFSTIDRRRRHAVILDERYFHFQTVFFQLFRSELFEISSFVMKQLASGAELDERNIQAFASIGYLKIVPMLFAAEHMTSPSYFLGEVAHMIATGPMGDSEEHHQHVVDLLAKQMLASDPPGYEDSILINLLIAHECAHVRLNGFSQASSLGRLALTRMQKFGPDKTGVRRLGGEPVEKLEQWLKYAESDPNLLEEVAADVDAIDNVLGHIADVDYTTFETALIAQASAHVAATIFGDLAVRIHGIARRTTLDLGTRAAAEPFVRCSLAMWHIILRAKAHGLPDAEFSRLLDCWAHVNTGTRFIEMNVRPGVTAFPSAVLGVLPDMDQSPYMRGLSTQEKRMRNAYFSCKALKTTGWQHSPPFMEATKGFSSP